MSSVGSDSGDLCSVARHRRAFCLVWLSVHVVLNSQNRRWLEPHLCLRKCVRMSHLRIWTDTVLATSPCWHSTEFLRHPFIAQPAALKFHLQIEGPWAYNVIHLMKVFKMYPSNSFCSKVACSRLCVGLYDWAVKPFRSCSYLDNI